MKTLRNILIVMAGLTILGSHTVNAQVSATVVVTLRVIPGPGAQFIQHQPTSPSEIPSLIANGRMTIRGIGNLSVSVQKENTTIQSQLNLNGRAPANLNVGTDGEVKRMTLTYLSS